MNKRKTTHSTKAVGKRKSILYNTMDKFKPTKIIYLVKYDEIQNIPASSRQCIKSTYNLLTFEDLDEAKEYLESVYEFTVVPLIENNSFKIILNTITETQLDKNSTDNIIYKKSTKMIGNNDFNKDQSKFYIFTIEEIHHKSLNG